MSLSGNASWTQEAGAAAETGNAVSIFNSGELTDVSGAGSFDLIDTAVLSGTVPKKQTVTADAIESHNALVKISGTVTNEGTLVLDSPSKGGEPAFVGNTAQIDNDGLLRCRKRIQQRGLSRDQSDERRRRDRGNQVRRAEPGRKHDNDQ